MSDTLDMRFTRLLSRTNSYGTLSCRDPRDRIYSLLCIRSDGDDLAINPDYSDANTVERLHLHTSVQILRTAPDLSLLGQACRFNQKDDLPSWVLSPSSNFRVNGLTPGFVPHARASLKHRPTFSANNSVLALQGSCVDVVKLVTPKVNSPERNLIGPMTALRIAAVTQCLSALVVVMSDVGVTVPHAAALWRTMRGVHRGLVSDTDQPIELAAGSLCSEIRSWAHKLRTFSSTLPSHTEETLAACGNLVQTLHEAIDSPLRGSAQSAMTLIEEELGFLRVLSEGVVFCVTQQGRIGIVQNEPMPGDVLAALEGADRLFTMRPEDRRYRLTGGAYVDGFMNGEYYVNVDPDEVDKIIELV